MKITVNRTSIESINHFRNLFLYENNMQFIHNKCHQYGWSDVYLFSVDEMPVGYGSTWGINNRSERDTIFEFYLLPEFRTLSAAVFLSFAEVSGTPFMESQTNDRTTSPLFFEFARNVQVQSILFRDSITTHLGLGEALWIDKTQDDQRHRELAYALTIQGQEVATGGLLLNYNFPFADVYMDVPQNYRGRGLGSLMVQELKKEAYRTGHVPAARCNVNNKVSKATLQKAGFATCGYLLVGDLKIPQ